MFISSLLIGAILPKKILFLGNSHTWTNNLPNMVKQLCGKNPPDCQAMSGSFLNELAKAKDVTDEIKKGKYDVVVLQGAMLSSSHKYKYSQDGAIQLAKLAKESKAQPYLFAEWCRRDWKETDYILGIYGEIAKATGATIIPICKSFDKVIATNKKADLWLGDGNHPSMRGSYLAALTIYRRLGWTAKPAWVPKEISQAEADAYWKATTY